MENPSQISPEQIESLVQEHHGWAESIARSVARAWNMDWQLDGLGSAALEALLFCARRYDPARGVPFRGYARRRIHEASTEEARRSKGWKRGSAADNRAREVSAELFSIFPELRDGQLPIPEEAASDADGGVRAAIRQVLVGASVLAAKQDALETPEDLIEIKRMVQLLAQFEPVHQVLIWKIYWEGLSLRSLAEEWETDELNVIREHKALLSHLYRGAAQGGTSERPKIRPALRDIALKLKRKTMKGPFGELLQKEKGK